MEAQEEQIMQKISECAYILRKNTQTTHVLMTGITILTVITGILACIFFGIIINFFH